MNNSTTHYDYEHNSAAPPRPDQQQTLFARLEKIASISQIARIFGGFAIIASMSLFMLQGWAEGNDITRYLKLLAQTGLLTASGLVLSFLIREFKGARVFFGLALVSVVANFTILGSLTYSLFPIDMQLVDYPDSMKWEVANTTIFLPVFFGAIALLSAVTYFGFSIFSRQISKPLSIGLLALSALLLIPIRAPLISVGLAAVALWSAWFLIQRLRRREHVIMTKETKASFLLLLLPGAIILTRALSFYNIDDAALLALSSLGVLCLRNVASLLGDNINAKRTLVLCQLPLVASISYFVTQLLPLSMNSVDLFIAAVIFMGFSYDQVLNSKDKWLSSVLTNLSVVICIPALLLNALVDYQLSYSIQAMLISGIAIMLTQALMKLTEQAQFSRTIAFVGLAAAILITLFDLFQMVQLSNWVVIGLVGAMLIISASLYERFGLQMFKK